MPVCSGSGASRRRARLEDGAFVIDGPTLLVEALAAGVSIEEVFATPAADRQVLEAAEATGAVIREVAAPVLARAVDTVTSQGLAAIARRLDVTLDEAVGAAAAGPLALVLVDVADPGNAGTLVRAAEAAGATAVLFCGSSVDPSNAKCVRASAGALFHLPVHGGGEGLGVLERLRERGIRTVASVVDGGRPHHQVDLTGPVALLLGSEAHGLPPEMAAAADERITIGMAGRIGSLNVAMAGAVLCFEALRQRQRRPNMIEIALDLLPDPVMVLDDARRLVALNAAAKTVLGTDAVALLGQPVGEGFDVRTGGGGPALREGLPPTEGEVDLVFRRPDGADVPVTATIRSADGITVLALRPSGERSGIAIISTVSHELRSPLTSVKGYTSLMLNRWDRLKDEQKLTMLEQVHHDADRVTRLVTELLDISRLETGRLVLRRQMVDLPALASSVVEKVGLGIPELDCTVAFPPVFPHVYADPDKVEQVLTNLVENAAKYGSPTAMSVTADVDGDSVSVAVRDTGAGIPEEDLPRVFTKFFRRDHGRPTGTGLGLWISQGLVEAHGGRLTATSQPGDGSTFRFTLPTDAFEREMDGLAAEPEPIGDAPS